MDMVTDKSTDKSTDFTAPEFNDKIMVCVDCGNDFVWEEGEQQFYWSKGLADPKRCLDCRQRRKATITVSRER